MSPPTGLINLTTPLPVSLNSSLELEGQHSFDTSIAIFRICLSVFGVVANSVTCVVLTNKRLWSPTSLLLLSLVAYDTVFLVMTLIQGLVSTLPQVDWPILVLVITYPVRYTAQTGSIYTTGEFKHRGGGGDLVP